MESGSPSSDKDSGAVEARMDNHCYYACPDHNHSQSTVEPFKIIEHPRDDIPLSSSSGPIEAECS